MVLAKSISMTGVKNVKQASTQPPDTIIISAREDSFYSVFLEEWCWYPIRISSEKLQSLHWIAVYQTAPISAITHFARVDQIVDYLDTGRYKIVFHEPQEFENPIFLGDNRAKTLQGQRYTTLESLKKAKVIEDLKPWL